MQHIKEVLLVIKDWIIHVFSPHCIDCEHDSVCQNCEYLKLLVEQERAEKSKILAMMFEPRTVEDTDNEVEERKPINTFVPWRVKRHKLEMAARRKNVANESGQAMSEPEAAN